MMEMHGKAKSNSEMLTGTPIVSQDTYKAAQKVIKAKEKAKEAQTMPTKAKRHIDPDTPRGYDKVVDEKTGTISFVPNEEAEAVRELFNRYLDTEQAD